MNGMLKNIDGYRVEKSLGEGASGEVYLVRLPGKQRYAALKLMKGEVSGAARIRFKREFSAAVKCSHPNIVTMYGMGDYRGRPYIIMEYVQGDDFVTSFRKNLRPRTPLPRRDWSRLISVTSRILDALSYLHGRKIIHRDIKPGNIKVTDEGEVKLLDFGLAGRITLNPKGDVSGGTPGYLSPEQLLNRGSDPRSDLYSLGICLFEVLCGVHPYPVRDDWQSLIQTQLRQPVAQPSKVHPTLGDDWDLLIERLTAIEPDCRFQTARLVLNVLMSIARSVHADTGTDEPRAKQHGHWGLLESRWIDTGGWMKSMLPEISGGTKSCVFFQAPSGSGKSRILREITQALPSDKPVVMVDVFGGGNTVQDLKWLIDELSTVYPSVRRDFERDSGIKEFLETSTGSGAPPEQLRRRFMTSFRRIVSKMAGEKPFVLLVDDLDKASFLLQQIIAEMCSMDSGHPTIVATGEACPENLRQSACLVDWKPFGLDDVRTFVTGVLGLKTFPKENAARILDLSGGRPGLIVDAFQSWIEDGYLTADENTWILHPPLVESQKKITDPTAFDDVSALPESARDIPETSRLERECLRVLAVHDAFCPYHLLSSIFAAREELFFQVIDGLLKNGWIEERIHQDEVFYRITRPMEKVKIRQALSPFHKSYIHRRIAETYQKLSTNGTSTSLELLAEHFAESDQLESSLTYLEKAADSARDRFENDLSIHWYQTLQDKIDQVNRIAPFTVAGVDHTVFKFNRFSPSVLRTAYIDIRKALSLNRLRIWMYAAREKGRVFGRTGEYGKAFESFQRLLEVAASVENTTYQGDALRFIGQILFYQKKYEEAEKYFLKALKLRQAMDDKHGIGDCLNALGAIAQQLNRLDDAVKYFQDALNVKQSLGDHRGVAYLRNNLGNIAFHRKKYEDALSYFVRGLEQLRELEDFLGQAYMLFNIGGTFRALNDWRNAVAHLSEALEIRRRMEDIRGAALCLREMGESYLQGNQWAEAVQCLHESANMFEELGRDEDAEQCRELIRTAESNRNSKK